MWHSSVRYSKHEQQLLQMNSIFDFMIYIFMSFLARQILRFEHVVCQREWLFCTAPSIEYDKAFEFTESLCQRSSS